MTPFPLPIDTLLGTAGSYLVYLLIGFGFGYVLEISGFAISSRLAAQFYFKDLTVLKVMFTAIIVAMVLIFAATGLGLLDYNLIWVNPTYLWPGIIGGLIMGVGFIVGGFCPGTSLVSVATFKIDGLFFTLGGLVGIFAFGEVVDNIAVWWNSSYLGRFTLMDWLGLDTGWVVLLVVLMALFMFWGGEQLERIIGKRDLRHAPRSRYWGAAILVVGAAAVLLIGQPDTADRWSQLAREKEKLLQERAVYIHPGELLASLNDRKLNLVMLDVRPEADYNLFHIEDVRHIPAGEVLEYVDEFQKEPTDTIFVVMSNDESLATDVWKDLVAESVPNVYILEGGINNWLATFASEEDPVQRVAATGDEALHYSFPAALGTRLPAATPDPHSYELEYTPKIKLDVKRGPGGGGCG